MASAAMQLISRIVKSGEMAKVQEWGVTWEDMLTAEERGMWNLIEGYYQRPESTGSVPGSNLLRHKFESFTLCDDPHMTLEGLCSEARKAALSFNIARVAKDLAAEAQIDPAGALAHAAPKLEKLLGFSSRKNDFDLRGLTEELMEDYKRVESGQFVSKVMWPWPIMNAITGGLQEDDFIVFYGRPKSMKTWVLCAFIAYCYLMGNKVLIYTKEMTPKNIMKRIVGCLLRLPYQELRSAKLSPPQRQELVEFYEMVRRSRLFDANMVDGTLQRTGSEGELTILSGKDAAGQDTIPWLKGKVEKYRPDVVFVDGLYLMSDHIGKQGQADHARVQNISRAARAMQLETKVPLVCTMQANRKAAGNAVANLDEIAFSDALAQDATGIFRTIRENDSPTIALIAGGAREYSLYGLRIYGRPATDFSEKEIMTEKDVLAAAEADARAQGGGSVKKPGGVRKKNNGATEEHVVSELNGSNGHAGKKEVSNDVAHEMIDTQVHGLPRSN